MCFAFFLSVVGPLCGWLSRPSLCRMFSFFLSLVFGVFVNLRNWTGPGPVLFGQRGDQCARPFTSLLESTSISLFSLSRILSSAPPSKKRLSASRPTKRLDPTPCKLCCCRLVLKGRSLCFVRPVFQVCQKYPFPYPSFLRMEFFFFFLKNKRPRHFAYCTHNQIRRGNTSRNAHIQSDHAFGSACLLACLLLMR